MTLVTRDIHDHFSVIFPRKDSQTAMKKSYLCNVNEN